jgi:nitrite reductase (NADH) small subunit
VTSVDDAVGRARSLRAEPALPAPAVEERWVDVIAESSLEPEDGVPALVDGPAVAVFKTHEGELFAVSNHDPVTGASVMARGIVGTRGEIPVVASPMYKHVFDLRTGRCLDDEGKTLRPYQVRVSRGVVQVRGIRDDHR